MSEEKIDNDRDRYAHGYDAGLIVDGEVYWSDNLKRYVIKDCDGVLFDIQEVMKKADGKTVRMTFVTDETVRIMEQMLEQANKT